MHLNLTRSYESSRKLQYRRQREDLTKENGVQIYVDTCQCYKLPAVDCAWPVITLPADLLFCTQLSSGVCDTGGT